MEEKHSRKAFAEKRAGRLILLALLILGIQAAAKSCSAVSVSTGEATMGEAMLKSIWDGARTLLYSQFMPGIAFMEEGGHGTWWLLREQIACLFPFYGYVTGQPSGEQGESAEDIRTILLAEAEEETWQGEEALPEDIPPEGDAGPAQGGSTAGPDSAAQPGEEDLADLLRAENQAAMEQRPGVFLPHEKQVNLDLEPLSDYETLIQQFYTVDANTVAGSDQLDVHKLMGQDMTISKDAEGPQILIYHTHAHEEFADSTPGDMSETIMGVGERLTTILTEEYGYQVLHHLGQYDTESRDDSYAVALGDLEALLQQYPSIQVVIDLHRDAMPEGTRLVMDLDGRPTARFMFFNGLSRTKKTGNISYLYNENLDSNLAFSFQMQKTAMEYYPNLTRRIYLRGYRYNMHLRPKSLLIELGAQNNTLEEVMNACDPLAHILDLVLSGSGQSGNAPAEERPGGVRSGADGLRYRQTPAQMETGTDWLRRRRTPAQMGSGTDWLRPKTAPTEQQNQGSGHAHVFTGPSAPSRGASADTWPRRRPPAPGRTAGTGRRQASRTAPPSGRTSVWARAFSTAAGRT